MAQFAARNKLFIKITSFKNKKIHTGTWRIPGTSAVNQIAHVVISLPHSFTVIDVGSCSGPNSDSGHFLAKVGVRERATKIQRASRIDKKKWDVEKLGNDSSNQNRKEYQQIFKAKLRTGNKGKEREELGVEEQW